MASSPEESIVTKEEKMLVINSCWLQQQYLIRCVQNRVGSVCVRCGCKSYLIKRRGIWEAETRVTRERGWGWSPVCPLEGGGLVTSTDLRRVFSPCTRVPTDCTKNCSKIKKKNHPWIRSREPLRFWLAETRGNRWARGGAWARGSQGRTLWMCRGFNFFLTTDYTRSV
jgi:hypothetical protein